MKQNGMKKFLVLLLLPMAVMIGCGGEDKPGPGGPGGGIPQDNVRPGSFVGNATIRPASSSGINYYKEHFGGGVVLGSSMSPPNLLIFLNGQTGEATASLDAIEYRASSVAVPITNGQLVEGTFSAIFVSTGTHPWGGAIIPGMSFIYKITITGDLAAGGQAGLFILNNPSGFVHVVSDDSATIIDLGWGRIGVEGSGNYVQAATITP